MRFTPFAAVAFAAAAALSQPAHPVLWRQPASIATVDLAGSIAEGVPTPRPPFTFIREDLSGTQPKVTVKDAAGVRWNVKFGFEVKPESFTWRLPRVLGYFVQPNFYIASGKIEALGKLQRQTASIKADGTFTDGRFQYRDPKIQFLKRTWTWTGNPFNGTPQLKGLEILIMLASNWDNKDGRAGLDETNTALFERRRARGQRELLYSFTDWGSGMGAWGDKAGQTDWNCADYTRQTPSFVQGIQNGEVVFGFEGHIHDGFQTGIRPADVAWLMRYLGQITDTQLGAALHASGAATAEAGCFTSAIRTRINQLRKASGNP